MALCTIVSRNYLAHARVLAESFRKHNDGVDVYVLVIDDVDGVVHDEAFTVLRPSDLALSAQDFAQMSVMYDVKELSTALKPWLLEHLLATAGGPVVYLDPDVGVFASLAPIRTLADERGLLLTQHLDAPLPRDGRHPR